MTMSFFKDFFYKVRVLLDENAPRADEEHEKKSSRSIDEAMNEEYHAPEKREYDYAEDDYDDYDESPSSLAKRMADEYIDDEDYEEDYAEEDEYFDEQPEPAYQRGYDEPDEDEQYFTPQPAPQAVREQTQNQPLPNRTEVTLREIARLSQKLDDATLEEYKRRIVMTKQQTGAVSALDALRILREYVDDNDFFDSNGDGLPDLSVK